MSIEYNKKNIILAKSLRKNATPQENHLWYDFLSTYKIRFQRQKAINNFIADFYCHKARLVIEIDGKGHRTAQGAQKDALRTDILENYGLTVIRFTNQQINTNFRGVCDLLTVSFKLRSILQSKNNCLLLSPASLREGGGPRQRW